MWDFSVGLMKDSLWDSCRISCGILVGVPVGFLQEFLSDFVLWDMSKFLTGQSLNKSEGQSHRNPAGLFH